MPIPQIPYNLKSLLSVFSLGRNDFSDEKFVLKFRKTDLCQLIFLLFHIILLTILKYICILFKSIF